MTLTKEQRDGLRTLERAATAGRWEGRDCRGLSAPADCINWATVGKTAETARVWSFEDTVFIAEARNLVPALLDDLDAALAENEARADFMRREGYRPCDVPACNCNSWHGGHAAERLRDLRDLLDGEGWSKNGSTILGDVKSLGDRTEAAESEVTALRAKLEEARRALGKFAACYDPNDQLEQRIGLYRASATSGPLKVEDFAEAARVYVSLDQTPAVSAEETA